MTAPKTSAAKPATKKPASKPAESKAAKPAADKEVVPVSQPVEGNQAPVLTDAPLPAGSDATPALVPDPDAVQPPDIDDVGKTIAPDQVPKIQATEQEKKAAEEDGDLRYVTEHSIAPSPEFAPGYNPGIPGSLRERIESVGGKLKKG